MCIALGFDVNTGQTRVEVFPQGTGTEFAKTWGTAVLDELTGRLERIHQFRKRI